MCSIVRLVFVTFLVYLIIFSVSVNVEGRRRRPQLKRPRPSPPYTIVFDERPSQPPTTTPRAYYDYFDAYQTQWHEQFVPDHGGRENLIG